MRRSMLALCVVLAAGCANLNGPAPGSPQVISAGEVVLAVGDSVVAESVVHVVFRGVPSDSRCPSQVQCIWAGDAAVVIASAYNGGWFFTDTLHTMLEPHAVTLAGYRITLLDLSPYPATADPIPQDAYVARLSVERLTMPLD